MFGLGGHDVVVGRPGDDVIFGDGGNDILIGGTGDDVLEAGAGVNSVKGGRGDDLFVLGLEGYQVIEDFNIDYDQLWILNRKNPLALVLGTPRKSHISLRSKNKGGFC